MDRKGTDYEDVSGLGPLLTFCVSGAEPSGFITLELQVSLLAGTQ